MGMNLILYIEKILDKLQSILHTLAGWVVGLLLFLGDFIGGHELAVGLVVFVTLMDAVALGYLSASGYPTEQDITDMNNDVVPTSLRADRVHFTTNGSYTMAHALSIKLKEVWNL